MKYMYFKIVDLHQGFPTTVRLTLGGGQFIVEGLAHGYQRTVHS